jgi:hypothetical protein
MLVQVLGELTLIPPSYLFLKLMGGLKNENSRGLFPTLCLTFKKLALSEFYQEGMKPSPWGKKGLCLDTMVRVNHGTIITLKR